MSTSAEDAIEELKKALSDYKFGAKLGISRFTDAEEGELEKFKIRIGVFGPTGAGKSALINTVCKILGRDEVAIQQSSGGEGTRILDDFGFDGFSMLDTRGFFNIDSHLEETEFFRILYGGVRPGDEIDRGRMGKLKTQSAGIAAHKLNKPPLSRQLHAVLWVIKGDDVRLINEDYLGRLNFVLGKLRDEAITLITVITHSDVIDQASNPAAARREATNKALEATKSYESNTFLIHNWTEKDDSLDDDTTKEVLMMIHAALECGERSVKIRQTKRKQAEKQSERQARCQEEKNTPCPVECSDLETTNTKNKTHCKYNNL